MTDRTDQRDPLDIDIPTSGRVYGHRRRVQLADGSPRGRMRLDALARFLQDVSDEDTTEVGLDPARPWVVRRVAMRIERFPVFREHLAVSTWCSGIGGRWAERRVRLSGDRGGRVDAAVLWVHLDERGRPARLDERFLETYGPAAGTRTVRARLQHGSPPEDATGSPFALRFVDVDLMGHVNNAVSWIPLEGALAARPSLRAPMLASMEHPAAIDPGDTTEVVELDRPDGLDLWIRVDGTVASSAQVRQRA